jgi:hypothetical protein
MQWQKKEAVARQVFFMIMKITSHDKSNSGRIRKSGDPPGRVNN